MLELAGIGLIALLFLTILLRLHFQNTKKRHVRALAAHDEASEALLAWYKQHQAGQTPSLDEGVKLLQQHTKTSQKVRHFRPKIK